MKDILDGLCTKVEAEREKVLKLTADELARLREKHALMLKPASETMKKVTDQHGKFPKILGDDWERYRRALQLDDEGK